jgi:hypothetical protein
MKRTDLRLQVTVIEETKQDGSQHLKILKGLAQNEGESYSDISVVFNALKQHQQLKLQK